MRCPSCKEDDTKVIDSRATEGGTIIRRRRMCQSCERRFTTKERIEEELRLSVMKVGERRVPYRRDNILRGVELACVKLPITEVSIQALVDHVEEDLFRNHEREVTTEQIGRYVGQHLRKLNLVAYVRFMSVHRKFDSIEEFVDEIRDMKTFAATDSPSQQDLFES